MWKYVSRRLKETFERTCNTLDLHRTWRCGGGGGTQQATSISQDNEDCTGASASTTSEEIQIYRKNCIRIFPNYYLCSIDVSESNGSSNDGHYDKKGKTYQDNNGHNGIQHDLLGAITWSGAIVCGWYASQLLCLNRRQHGWSRTSSGHCGYSNLINTSSRAIHSNISSYLAFASPIHPSNLSQKTLQEKFDFKAPHKNFDDDSKNYHFKLVEINNENDTTDTSSSTRRTSASTSSTSSSDLPSQKQTINEAVSDLVKFLGETEFKLGLQYISAGRYRIAVSHLKLASRHHHVGATFNLGLCYEQGLGVSKNLRRAMECYQYASSMGHPKAMYNLGVYYAQGLGGLHKNYDAARQCFIAAAKLGQNDAKRVLGWSVDQNDDNYNYDHYEALNSTSIRPSAMIMKTPNNRINENDNLMMKMK